MRTMRGGPVRMRMKGPTEGLPWSALFEMRRYYEDRIPYHDGYMSWDGQEGMEELLAPVIGLIEADIEGRDVLEVACGTGNWTQVLSRRARSVVATDLFEGYLEMARSKGFPSGNVTLVEADAYSLEGVAGPFDAAFAADWWSHMPRSMVEAFMATLHDRLRPGARVVIVDMLRSESHDLAFCRYDAEGNEVQLRTLPTGESYQVVKNFPKPEVLRGRLEYWSTDVEYHEFEDLGRWVLRYSLRSR